MRVSQQAGAVMHQTAGLRHTTRGRGCLIITGLGILISLLSCVASLAIYLVFPPPPLNILVMGLDARANEGAATRTDSIVIAGIQPRTLDVSLLSIPRDLFINVPGYGMQRINTVNVLGEVEDAGQGAILLSNAIESNFNIEIDRTVRLDFQAFVALVDAVGGVQVDVPYTIYDPTFPTADGGVKEIRFEAGTQQLNGEQALIYVRTRHSDDDYRRAERQQQIITALGRKLLNPITWPQAWVAVQQHTDTDLTLLEVMRVMPPLLLKAGAYQQMVIDRDYILPGDGYSVPNYDALRPFLNQYFD